LSYDAYTQVLEKEREKESEIQMMKAQIESIFTVLSNLTNQNQLNDTAKILYNA
jgi:hypothetical protein